jgi:hypothetical protein
MLPEREPAFDQDLRLLHRYLACLLPESSSVSGGRFVQERIALFSLQKYVEYCSIQHEIDSMF